jgi:thymidylate synthase
MNNLDKQYTELLQDILENGTKRQDRTGTGTLSVFGRQIRHRMSEGFPLVTTKKMAFKTMVTELIWFLKGDTNIKYLTDNGVRIWNGDAYKNWCRQFEVDSNNFNGEELAKGHNDQCWGYPLLENTSKEYKRGQINAYLEGKAEKPFFYLTQEEFINKIKTDDDFAKKWGELGPVYGAQWREWKQFIPYNVTEENCQVAVKVTDQIANLINDLKTNPDSRRLMVSAWNVGELDQMVLPPCHYGFQVYTRELSFAERVRYYETTFGRLHFIPPSPDALDARNIPTRAISLMYNLRSQDVGLGWSFNVSSYALLLMMIAKQVNMVPDELIMNMGDCHIYLNHIDGLKEQIGRDLTDEERYNIWFDNNYETGMERYFDPNNLPNFDDDYYVPTPKRTREPYPLPTLKLSDKVVNDISEYTIDDIILENYKCHPAIKLPLSN